MKKKPTKRQKSSCMLYIRDTPKTKRQRKFKIKRCEKIYQTYSLKETWMAFQYQPK